MQSYLLHSNTVMDVLVRSALLRYMARERDVFRCAVAFARLLWELRRVTVCTVGIPAGRLHLRPHWKHDEVEGVVAVAEAEPQNRVVAVHMDGIVLRLIHD